MVDRVECAYLETTHSLDVVHSHMPLTLRIHCRTADWDPGSKVSSEFLRANTSGRREVEVGLIPDEAVAGPTAPPQQLVRAESPRGPLLGVGPCSSGRAGLPAPLAPHTIHARRAPPDSASRLGFPLPCAAHAPTTFMHCKASRHKRKDCETAARSPRSQDATVGARGPWILGWDAASFHVPVRMASPRGQRPAF